MNGNAKEPLWLVALVGLGFLLMSGMAALALEITISAYHSKEWALALRIGPLLFVGSANCAFLALAALKHGPTKVLLAETQLLPRWWWRLARVLFCIAAACFVAGVVGDFFQPG